MQDTRETINLLVPPIQSFPHPLVFFVFEKLQDRVIKFLKNELTIFNSPFLTGRQSKTRLKHLSNCVNVESKHTCATAYAIVAGVT